MTSRSKALLTAIIVLILILASVIVYAWQKKLIFSSADDCGYGYGYSCPTATPTYTLPTSTITPTVTSTQPTASTSPTPNPLLNQNATTDDMEQHWSLYNGTEMTFHLKKNSNIEHKLKVTALSENKFSATITSDPVNVDLDIDQSKNLDIDGDGVNDIKLKLLSIHQTGSYGLVASVLYTQLESTSTVSPTSSSTSSGATTSTSPQINQLVSTGPSIIWIIIGILSVSIIVLTIFYFRSGHEENLS